MQPSVFQFSALDDTLRLTTNCDKFKFQSFVPDSSKRVSLTFFFPPIFDYFFGVNRPPRLKSKEITIRLPILSPERGLKSQL